MSLYEANKAANKQIKQQAEDKGRAWYRDNKSLFDRGATESPMFDKHFRIGWNLAKYDFICDAMSAESPHVRQAESDFKKAVKTKDESKIREAGAHYADKLNARDNQVIALRDCVRQINYEAGK